MIEWEWNARKNFRRFLVVGLVVLIAVGLFACPAPYGNPKVNAKRLACLSNVKQLARASLLYKEEWDQTYPPGESWHTAIETMLPSLENDLDRTLRCPQVADNGYGYAMLNSLAGRKAPTQPETHILLFESTELRKNATASLATLPKPGRHEGKNMVAYADSHAKVIPSE